MLLCDFQLTSLSVFSSAELSLRNILYNFLRVGILCLTVWRERKCVSQIEPHKVTPCIKGTRIGCLPTYIIYTYYLYTFFTILYTGHVITPHSSHILTGVVNRTGAESRQRRIGTPVGYQLINDVYTVNRLLSARRPTAARLPIIRRVPPVRDIIIITILVINEVYDA